MEGEKEELLNSLTAGREHVLGILEGLSSEALHRAVLPSSWTCLGLVNHLAFDVERFWFRQVLLGESIGDDRATGSESPRSVPSDMKPEIVFGCYRREVEKANVVISATPRQGFGPTSSENSD